MMRHELSKLDEAQSSNRLLSEPHFDDEATLLSARRVVPFHKLADKTNSKRNLLFGAILAATLVMGIVGGVIYARLERTQGPQAETTEPVAASPVLQDGFVSSSVQDKELASTRDESTAPDVDNPNPKSVDKRRNPSTSVRKEVSVQSEPDDSDYLANEREIRRAERRAARRARREAAREAQRSDDLFRIQEIFEGSSRP